VVDQATLATIAGLIGAVGAAVLVLRVQRETDQEARAIDAKNDLINQLISEGMSPEQAEKTADQEIPVIIWLPVADWLILAATVISLLAVILPLVHYPEIKPWSLAASGSAAILTAGYIFAILAHYRIIFKREWIVFGEKRKGPRGQFEPPEVITSIAVVAIASLFFLSDCSGGSTFDPIAVIRTGCQYSPAL